MNAFAEAQLNHALFRIDTVVGDLEGRMGCDDARASLLRARGQLIAMKQLLDLEEQCAAPDTERPKLTVVK